MFSSILVPSALTDPDHALSTHNSEKHRLENTVCLRTGPTITSQKLVKDEKVYKPHFSPEFGGFSLEKIGEFRLNPGSRTKFANLPNLAMRWLVHS